MKQFVLISLVGAGLLVSACAPVVYEPRPCCGAPPPAVEWRAEHEREHALHEEERMRMEADRQRQERIRVEEQRRHEAEHHDHP